MMNLAVFITGLTGAGKSTLVKKLGRMGWHTIHTGDLFREEFGTNIAKEHSAITPEYANDYLEKCIYDKARQVKDEPGIGLLAIESVPRNLESVNWVEWVRQLGFTVVVFNMIANENTRIDRITSRDITDPVRLKMDKRKIKDEQESDRWTKIMDDLSDRCISYSTIDTSFASGSVEDITGIDTSAIEMMTIAAKNFLGHKSSYAGSDVNRMILRCMEECDEALSSTSPANLTEELIDALWFLILAIVMTDMNNGQSILYRFMAKACVNEERLNSQTKVIGTEANE